MQIFKDRTEKKNYKILKSGDKIIVKVNIFFNIWFSLRKHDFEYGILNIYNRIEAYTFLLFISILLPILFGPISTLTYISYLIFIIPDFVENTIYHYSEYESLEKISLDIDKIISSYNNSSNTLMIFDHEGNGIKGKQLDRLNKLERIIK